MNHNTNMGIYKIRNKVNDKFYIGSSVDLKKRRRDHFRELKQGIHTNQRLQHSYNKYGRSNFTFEIMEFVESRPILIDREQYWIDKYNASDRNVGFNINRLASGGGNFGEINGNYGNTGIKNPLSKQFAQIDPKTLKVVKVWGASIEIQRELSIHGGNICKISILVEEENIWKKSQGYYWCYEKDLYKLPTKIDFIDPQMRKVVQIDSQTDEIIKIFNSIGEASRELGIGPENISRVCKGKNKTSGGFKWKYDDEEYEYEGKKIVSLKGKKNPRARKVVQLTDCGKYINTYNTVKEAAEFCRVSVQALYVNLNRGAGHLTGGYKWLYIEEYEKLKSAN